MRAAGSEASLLGREDRVEHRARSLHRRSLRIEREAAHAAELFAAAWRRGLYWRVVASLLALSIALGNASELAAFFRYERGDPLPAMREISATNQAVLLNARDRAVVTYLGRRHGVALTMVELNDFCRKRPTFVLTSDKDAPETMAYPGADCSAGFRRVLSTPFWGLSGSSWTLYEAE